MTKTATSASTPTPVNVNVYSKDDKKEPHLNLWVHFVNTLMYFTPILLVLGLGIFILEYLGITKLFRKRTRTVKKRTTDENGNIIEEYIDIDDDRFYWVDYLIWAVFWIVILGFIFSFLKKIVLSVYAMLPEDNLIKDVLRYTGIWRESEGEQEPGVTEQNEKIEKEQVAMSAMKDISEKIKNSEDVTDEVDNLIEQRKEDIDKLGKKPEDNAYSLRSLNQQMKSLKIVKKDLADGKPQFALDILRGEIERSEGLQKVLAKNVEAAKLIEDLKSMKDAMALADEENSKAYEKLIKEKEKKLEKTQKEIAEKEQKLNVYIQQQEQRRVQLDERENYLNQVEGRLRQLGQIISEKEAELNQMSNQDKKKYEEDVNEFQRLLNETKKYGEARHKELVGQLNQEHIQTVNRMEQELNQLQAQNRRLMSRLFSRRGNRQKRGPGPAGLEIGGTPNKPKRELDE